ncbi:MAG: hypothetical protein ACODAD_07450 [Planctomycetota bacterium]
MTIQVVCECGIRKEVPEHWRGKRVKCKCGRRFVVGATTQVQHPPVSAPPLRDPETALSTPPGSGDSAVPRKPEQDPRVPPTAQRESVAARYRARHKAATYRKRVALGGITAVVLLCLIALLVVSRKGFVPTSNDTDQTNVVDNDQQANREDVDPETPQEKRSGPGSDGRTFGPTSALDHDTGDRQDRLSQTIELEADDGLLIIGLFNPVPEPLNLSEKRLEEIEALKSQFEKKANELASGEIELSKWFMEAEEIANKLLKVLTDEQRGQLREMIQQGKIARVRLEEYAAEIRPELETPTVSWNVEPDGIRFATIEACSLSSSASGHCLRTVAPSGIVAIETGQSEKLAYDVWDLEDDRRIGSRDIPPAASGDVTLVSRGGRFIVRGGENSGGYRVRVWPIDSSSPPKIQSLPKLESNDSVSSYQLVDCVAHRVLCVSERGFWVWDLRSDDTRESRFPDWVPPDMPACTISPGGRYVAMAHRHPLVVDAKNYHFLEVAIYELDGGNIVGNSVLAPDYRPFHVKAISFSYHGRELAILWDSERSPAIRRLTHMSALDGELIGTHRELPVSADEPLTLNELNDRQLMWLPEEMGWVVNLELLVDAQSEVLIDMDLPERLSIAPPESLSSVTLVEAIPAGNNRLLLITLGSSRKAPAEKNVTGRLIELPEFSPFL